MLRQASTHAALADAARFGRAIGIVAEGVAGNATPASADRLAVGCGRRVRAVGSGLASLSAEASLAGAEACVVLGAGPGASGHVALKHAASGRVSLAGRARSRVRGAARTALGGFGSVLALAQARGAVALGVLAAAFKRTRVPLRRDRASGEQEQQGYEWGAHRLIVTWEGAL